MIKPAWGQETGAFLTVRGYDVNFKMYSGVGHEIGYGEVMRNQLVFGIKW